MNILITAIIAAITTAIGSIITFIFTKKKYNAEVESVEISNLKTSVEVYEKITIIRNNPNVCILLIGKRYHKCST